MCIDVAVNRTQFIFHSCRKTNCSEYSYVYISFILYGQNCWRSFRAFLRVSEASWTRRATSRNFSEFLQGRQIGISVEVITRGCGGGAGIRPKIKILARGPPLRRFPDVRCTRKAPLRSLREYTCERTLGRTANRGYLDLMLSS